LDAATDLGYRRFRCRQCGRRFNERTGTPFNHLEFPTDIVFQVLVFRLLFKLSLRDLVRMFLMRGYEFTYETVREWEERFAPLLAEHLRRKRTGTLGAALLSSVREMR
jgi:putative transposase